MTTIGNFCSREPDPHPGQCFDSWKKENQEVDFFQKQRSIYSPGGLLPNNKTGIDGAAPVFLRT
jgi:hypothetical protein